MRNGPIARTEACRFVVFDPGGGGAVISPWWPFWAKGAWRYDFYVEGKRYRRSTGVRDPEALEIAIEVAKGVHDAAWERALSPFPTLKEAADLYLDEFDSHKKEVERIVDYFGPFVPIDESMPSRSRSARSISKSRAEGRTRPRARRSRRP